MRRIILLFGLLLAACTPQSGQSSHEDGMPSMDHGSMEETDIELEGFTIEDKSLVGEIGYDILQNGKHFTDYGVSHTKRMHLIVVRDDLTHFQHLHPVQDQYGVWRTPFVAGAGGTYWIYADFVDGEGKPATLRFTKEFDGDPDIIGYTPDRGRIFDDLDDGDGEEKTIDGYRVQLSKDESYGGGFSDVTLYFRVYDAVLGHMPKLEQYLGALGHVIILSTDGEFLHVHPSSVGSGGTGQRKWTVSFQAKDVPEGTYRIFAQFQIMGQIVTIPFDWSF